MKAQPIYEGSYVAYSGSESWERKEGDYEARSESLVHGIVRARSHPGSVAIAVANYGLMGNAL